MAVLYNDIPAPELGALRVETAGQTEEIPIEWLGLPNRERNFLLRNQITTVAELCAYSQEDLLQLPKIGNGMLSTIVHALDTVNLSLEK